MFVLWLTEVPVDPAPVTPKTGHHQLEALARLMFQVSKRRVSRRPNQER